MTRTASQWLLALAVALLVGAVLYLLTDAVAVASAAGVAWGSAAGLLAHFRARFPDSLTADEWTRRRWTGLGVAVITFAGLLGVNAIESLQTDVRFALAAVVLGVGYVGYLTGSLAELDGPTAD